VLGFVTACIRKADSDLRKFLEARVLFLETKDAARQLAESPNLIFAVRGEATELAGRLSEKHPVILPLGRESLRNADAIRLKRPSTFEMAEALKTMGVLEEQALRTARECDRSVTILARRIPSASAKLPSWHADQVLIPALLAGAWDAGAGGDRECLAQLSGEARYEDYEKKNKSLPEV
jgi:hypothetical protein